MTKPGIIRGNLMMTAAGFIFASGWHFGIDRFVASLAGTALVIASGCTFNNYLDLEIDRKMDRTSGRALVTGRISPAAALAYGAALGVAGELVLIIWVNHLTALIGLVGWIAYVVLYGFAKRRSVHGTLVGTISGSTPPLAGYTAATGHLGAAAWLLFLVMACWQMAHFYGIALYRYKDYQAAGIPVLPVVKGTNRTKREIIIYTAAFAVSNLALAIWGHGGKTYGVVMALISLAWLWKGRKPAKDDQAWGKRMFLFSLVTMMGLALMLVLSPLLP